MGCNVLVVTNATHFPSSTSACVLQRVVLGCADVPCTAAIAFRDISSCQNPSGMQLSHPGGAQIMFLTSTSPFRCTHCLIPKLCSPPSVNDAEVQITQLPKAQYFQGGNSRQPVFALRAVSNHLGYSSSIFSCWLGFFTINCTMQLSTIILHFPVATYPMLLLVQPKNNLPPKCSSI